MSRPNRKRVQKQERRPFALPLLRRALVPLLLLSLLGGAGYWLNDSLRIQQWKVEGSADIKGLVEDAVARHLAEHNDLWHSWPSRLRQTLIHDVPDLADAQVQRNMSGTLLVRVQARQPVALWQKQDQVWLVDAHAMPYRPLHKGEWPDFPLLRMNKAHLTQALTLLQAVHHSMPARLEQISELHYSKDRWKLIMSGGEMWLLPDRNMEQTVMRIAYILGQPRWKHRRFRVDARDNRRWYLRIARQEGVI